MREAKEGGVVQGRWNGKDKEGKSVSPGEYTWKVVVNRSSYVNIGTIGNSGQPPTTSGHVPVYLEGVAVDAKQGVYTVHGWDEAHFSVIKWSSKDGHAEFNTDNAVNEALLRAIAVEPDGSYAYVTGEREVKSENEKTTKFGIWRIKLIPGQKSSKVEDFSKAGRNIAVSERNAELLEKTAARDRELIHMPLMSLALVGDILYATDALEGGVLLFDKRTGELKQEIPISMPCGIAVEPNGKIWVGHEHEKVSVLRPDGKVLATPITDLKDVRSLSFRDGKLYVADRGASQVRIYKVEGDNVVLEKTLGEPGRPGDRAPDRFTSIGGMAVDPAGNILISDRAGQGARLQKLSPEFKQLWELFGLEFSSQATFGVQDPDLLFSATKNAYRIDRKTGGWEFLGSGKTDSDYFGNFDTSHRGPPRVVRFGEKDFFYFPAGDGIAIYRIDPPEEESRGPTLKLVGALAGAEPLPDGKVAKTAWKLENRFLWSWHDEQGDNAVQKEEIAFAATPGNPPDWDWPRGGLTVDDKGWIWIASYGRRPPNPHQGSAIWAIPPKGPNKLGNPVYDWNSAVVVVNDQAGPEALDISKDDFQWKLVGRSSEDGMIYGLGKTQKKAGAPQDGGLHMGGNVLLGFREKSLDNPGEITKAAWSVVLPKMAVGLAPIPGGKGGVFIGGDPWRGGVRHYTKDGLLIGGFHSDQRFGTQPVDWPSGL
ncbi:MAG TPA: hypothetical protein VIS99_04525, partial [Terrimicrobiaceae bacterium]